MTYNVNRMYNIKKGNHWPNWIWPKPVFEPTDKVYDFKAVFDVRQLLDITRVETRLDYNPVHKLFGVTLGNNIHNNSIRIGYRVSAYFTPSRIRNEIENNDIAYANIIVDTILYVYLQGRRISFVLETMPIKDIPVTVDKKTGQIVATKKEIRELGVNYCMFKDYAKGWCVIEPMTTQADLMNEPLEDLYEPKLTRDKAISQDNVPNGSDRAFSKLWKFDHGTITLKEVTPDMNGKETEGFFPFHALNSKIGWISTPYYGGEYPAPSELNIKMEWRVVNL